MAADPFADLADTLRVHAEQEERELPPPTSPMDVSRALIDAPTRTRPGCRSCGTGAAAGGSGGPPGGSRSSSARWRPPRTDSPSTPVYEKGTKHGSEDVPWAPNRHKIADLLDALAAIVHLPEDVAMPAGWTGRTYDGLLVSTANGLLDVEHREVLTHTPLFFNATSVPFDFDPDASDPDGGSGSWRSCGRRDSSRSARCRSGSATRSPAGSTCTRSCCWSARPAPGRASPPASWARSSARPTSPARPCRA